MDSKQCFLALLFLAEAPQQSVGQSADWSPYDTSISNLCSPGTGTPPSEPRMVQRNPTTFQVFAMGTPTQVYIKDQYGSTLSYLEKTGGLSGADLAAVDIGSRSPDELTVYAHYDSNCNTMQSNLTKTWKSLVNDYVSSDSSSFSSDALSNLTAADIARATPTLSKVDYAAGNATVNFTRLQGVEMPYLYVRGDQGVLLYVEMFPEPATADTTVEINGAFIPDFTTSLSACTFACADYSPPTSSDSLPNQIAAVIESTSSNGGALAASVSLTGEILSVPADCPTSGYVIYGKAPSGDVIAMAKDQELSVPISGVTSVEVKQLCDGTLKTQAVSLDPLRSAYASAMNDARASATPDQQAVPLSCTVNGVTHAFNDIWRAEDGSSCACRQGNVECGSVEQHITYYSGWEVAGITVSSMVLFLVVAAVAYVYYMKENARRVVEGRRKLSAGQVYCTSGTAGSQPGQHEIELPTPAGSITPG